MKSVMFLSNICNPSVKKMVWLLACICSWSLIKDRKKMHLYFFFCLLQVQTVFFCCKSRGRGYCGSDPLLGIYFTWLWVPQQNRMGKKEAGPNLWINLKDWKSPVNESSYLLLPQGNGNLSKGADTSAASIKCFVFFKEMPSYTRKYHLPSFKPKQINSLGFCL